MGVPKFFRWISERYPCLSELVKEYQIPEFDNLYLDMNGIIHMCSHPNDFDPHFRITDEKIFKDIFHYIEVLFRMIQPRKLFFMAVDGVAPRAKMNQQRGRRFRSAKEAEILENKARERGEALPSEARFDSNCITPGTEFMARLHEQLKYFVTYKMSTDPQWKGVKIILSGHETPGEGEHKIMDYIRYMKSQPNYDPNTRHCLYGLDADLIMLGLCSHEPHFSLLREEVKYGRKAKQTRTTTPEETKFFLLHLSLMREYLDLEFDALKSVLPFPFDIEKIIDDWVLMGFLVGNDFIPPLPDMHIINGALPTLYQAYIDVLPTLGGYINEGGTLNLERFKKYMQKLSAFDVEQFRETYADLKYFQGKTGRRPGSKERHSYKNTGIKDIDDPEPVKPVKNPELAALIELTEQELVMSEEDDDDDVEGWESYDSDGDDHENALFYLEFHQHKRDYYMKKLEYATVNSEVLRSQADGYVRAIQWNLHYYYNGVCSWSWFYPHHYAPYISDICNFSGDLELNYDMGTPFLPFQQLLAVLPAASKKLLPVPYQQLMVKEESPIFHYYPSEFKTDLNGKKQEWEAVVLIPFIDEVSLLEAMAPCGAMLTEEEHKRNSHGPMLIYTYTDQDLGVYEAPEHFPAVKHNHASTLKVSRDEIHVDPKHLVKGLCPGVRLDVYFPGFPTLKHIPHTSRLQKCKVKVFEQPSQGYNMILEIVDQGKPDIKEVAMELLGHSIFVAWPHLIEARVVAVSNKDFQYGLRDDSGMGATPQLNIEEVKGTTLAQWGLQRRGIEEQYANRLGVQIGETNILVHATPLTGRKYVFGVSGKITLEKQWTEMPVAYALQTTVRDIAVHDRSFQQFKTLNEVFPPKSACFMLGHPHYGAMGEVVDYGNTVKNGRVKVSMSVTPEPNLDEIRKQHHDSMVQYMAGNVAAQRLGVSSHLVSRVTGTIYIVQGDKNASIETCNKVNVGLNLKFNKRNEEIPGYTRKEGSMWQYSNKAVELVRNYMQNFPELFDYLAKHTGNDLFYESDVFPSTSGRVTDISNWLKEQHYTKVERHVCGSEVLEPELVIAVEKQVDNFQLHGCRVKTVTMQVKPHLLYKPALQVGNISPDPSATHRLFDRIVNVRDSYTVPIGLKGTIIGIHHSDNDADLMYDVVFDKPFPGGMTLNCSENRGYRIPKPAMLNLSHGQRVEQVKTVNKPTAVVQPSGNMVMQDNCWNQGHISAFASWSNNPQPVHVVPSSLAGPQLYRALQQPSFPLMGNTRQPNPASARKPKQNYASPMNKAPGSAPTEFQAIWTQLQKATPSPQKPNLSTPTAPSSASAPNTEVTGDPGTELLKKMLRISDETPHRPKHNTKQVSVEDIFEHARVTTPNKDTTLQQGFCVQLLNYFQQKGYGIPRYNYINNLENGKVRAQVVLPDMRAFTGDFSNTREQASESAARLAFSALSIEPNHRNDGLAAKPGTNTLPIPPQQWYQQQSPQHFGAQSFHHGRQDVTPEWRRGPGPDMVKQFKPPAQPPFMFPHYQQQQHWRGSGMASSSPNWRQVYQHQQQPVIRQQEWHGANWRQDDPQKKFVPLQAVKQQRNKPRQQQSQPPVVEQKPTDKNSDVAENTQTKLENNKVISSCETNRPSSTVTKPVVSRPRKPRLAANFSLSMDCQ